MRVLFYSMPANAHLYNLIPLAWAFRSAGHDVVFASQPDLVDAIKKTGIPAVSVGKDSETMKFLAETPPEDTVWGSGYRLNEKDPEKLTYDYLTNMFAAYCSPGGFGYYTNDEVLDDLVAFARDWKTDLVVWDALSFSGPIAARAAGAANVRVLQGMDHWVRMRERMLTLAKDVPEAERVDPVADWLGERLARYGAEFAEEVAVGTATIDPLPPGNSYDLDFDYLQMRSLPFNGPTEIPAWVRERPAKPRIALTLGLTTREVHDNGVPAADLIGAIADLEVEVVATLSHEQLSKVMTVPENVRAVEFVPLNALLPSCSAIIHHCGTGTTGCAVINGVPQIVVPGNLWSEDDTGQYIADRGAGLVTSPEELTAEGLRDMVVRILDDSSFQAGADQLQKETLAAPSPADVVIELEKLAADR
ncbi:L-desosaminyltransferase/L-2-deoxyfucosyltransferase/glycosyltransferase DesVII [Herbihabitans rhizosphaerae]|uniref:L-desosaminyltransferase/L-2-deoxyfucosyltransferase/glycosyltransferase DesVII n=1 Tax=Herbihabitans rhizosphaerae TaxID=1872711 RepID=A0A4Q7KGJ1_9PSEU|nr:activator-dependent family glycosyltransferase [Herbihabitans rhizosphaerae]RZS32686.1 L-desosaminyltransferase/L-2-deoxyfucosyltransferase/glycosyltransferase DesVII [Herbihabitans rhizosphaerae]